MNGYFIANVGCWNWKTAVGNGAGVGAAGVAAIQLHSAM